MTSQAHGSIALSVDDLVVRFKRPRASDVQAISNVSISLPAQSTLALIGESGSGKSTFARAVCGLVPSTTGRVQVAGVELQQGGMTARDAGAAGIQMVVQDSGGALNPRWPIWRIISEPYRLMQKRRGTELRTLAAKILDDIGLPAEFLDRYPHQLSGGQRQRVNIARALAAEPTIIALDEAVSALDLSVRNEILGLLSRLKQSRELTYLFITHDMGAVVQIATHVAVLYLGKLVENGPVREVVQQPKHPYTRALVGAVPTIGKPRAATVVAQGEADDAGAPPPGCRFHRRCPFVADVCRTTVPELTAYSGRQVACHRIQEIDDLLSEGGRT
jgi:oligopeptide/dipeptide ABC transporter ATP-binding protein